MLYRISAFLSVLVCIFAGMVEAQQVSAASMGTEECRWSDAYAVSDLDGEAMAMVV